MKIADSTVLVTAANRGLGKALVEEALRRDAKRVCAGVRQPFAHANRRVTPLMLDITNAAQIRGAVEKVDALDILINNAGISFQADLSDRVALERLLAVNFFGTYDVTQAFLPVLARTRSAIVNVLSLASLAAVPFDPLYSISKSAAQAIFDGVERGNEEIFPDPMSESIAEGWRSSASKALERRFAAYVAETPVKSTAAHASMRR
jgi:NAD(P)-dependent dehydrogenase (short-subunit alcohol dehydrogenase family)